MAHEPLIDWTDPGIHDDPYPYYRRLRETEPIHFCLLNGQSPVWMISRRDDAVALLQDPRFITAATEPDEGEENPLPPHLTALLHILKTMMPGRDGRDHTRLRRSVSGAFTRSRLERMRPAIGEILDRLLWKNGRSRDLDLIAAVARPLPVMVMAGLLGLPEHDHDELMVLADEASAVADRTVRLSARDGYAHPERLRHFRGAMQGARTLVRYFERILRERRQAPGDDLLSTLLATPPEAGGLSDPELVAMCIALLGAGQGTTRDMLGNGMLALLRHPREKARLLSKPERIPQAVEEMLRYDPAIQVAFRKAAEDLEFGGFAMMRGHEVNVLIGAANRDPAHCADPDRFDITRENTRHIAFGDGPHYCLGAHLSRIELEVTISMLLFRYPDIGLGAGGVERRPGYVFRGLARLPLRL